MSTQSNIVSISDETENKRFIMNGHHFPLVASTAFVYWDYENCGIKQNISSLVPLRLQFEQALSTAFSVNVEVMVYTYINNPCSISHSFPTMLKEVGFNVRLSGNIKQEGTDKTMIYDIQRDLATVDSQSPSKVFVTIISGDSDFVRSVSNAIHSDIVDNVSLLILNKKRSDVNTNYLETVNQEQLVFMETKYVNNTDNVGNNGDNIDTTSPIMVATNINNTNNNNKWLKRGKKRKYAHCCTVHCKEFWLHHWYNMRFGVKMVKYPSFIAMEQYQNYPSTEPPLKKRRLNNNNDEMIESLVFPPLNNMNDINGKAVIILNGKHLQWTVNDMVPTYKWSPQHEAVIIAMVNVYKPEYITRAICKRLNLAFLMQTGPGKTIHNKVKKIFRGKKS